LLRTACLEPYIQSSPSIWTEGPMEGAACAGLGLDRFGHSDGLARLEFSLICK
jgi:hypothetical protein